MNITAKTSLCMVIGDPVEHSLSPPMHNAGYEALGLDFVFVGAHVKPEDLGAFVAGVRAMGIRGVSCTLPHKLAIMEHLDDIDETARAIGAVNTIVNDNGRVPGSAHHPQGQKGRFAGSRRRGPCGSLRRNQPGCRIDRLQPHI
jgi:shikimate dehydrogenase